MASASPAGDRLLWLTVAVGGLTAVWYVPHLLQHAKELAAVSAPKPKIVEPQLKRDAEAAIKPETLAVLTSASNHNLSSAAIRLTAARFVKDSAAKSGLLHDLSSKDWHRRDRAIKALQLLLTNPVLKGSNLRPYFLDQSSYTALVTALVNILPEHDQDPKAAPATSPVKPAKRPAHERNILELLLSLLEEPRTYGTNSFYIVDAQPAINAGIVTKWLNHYPFPCSLPQYRRYNYKRSDVCQLLDPDVWGQDDVQMSRLIQILTKMPSGARQLADVGLRSSSFHARANIGSREWATRSHPTLSFADDRQGPAGLPNGHNTDDEEEDGLLIENADLLSRLGSTQRRQHTQQTLGQRSRQRRHRQAIVVAEAGAPFRPENILQRQPTETEMTWHREVHDRQGQLLRSSSTRSASADDGAVEQLARERIDGLHRDRDGFTPLPMPDLDELPANTDADQYGETNQEDSAPG